MPKFKNFKLEENKDNDKLKKEFQAALENIIKKLDEQIEKFPDATKTKSNFPLIKLHSNPPPRQSLKEKVATFKKN